jgi:hypothetical protein
VPPLRIKSQDKKSIAFQEYLSVILRAFVRPIRALAVREIDGNC